MWRSKVFTLMTGTSVMEKCPNILKGCFRSSHSFKGMNRYSGPIYKKKNTDSSAFEFTGDSSGNECKEKSDLSVKHVLCKELNDGDIKQCVALKGRIISGADNRWLMRDKSGNIYLHVPENKKAELEDCISKFKPNVHVKVTGIVKKNLKNAGFPYKISLDSVSFVKVVKDIKHENELLLNLNEKELSKIFPVHMSWFFQRSHPLDQLNNDIVGQSVTLCGWVSWICDLNKSLFMLEDGVNRVLIDCSEKATELAVKLEDLETNVLLLLDGEVVKRTEDEINPRLDSGTIKVCLKDIKAMDKIDQEALDQFNNLQSNRDDMKEKEENCGTNQVGEADRNLYTLRSHNLGEINKSLVGQRVHLMGWVIFSRMNQFLVLKDKYGTVQLLLPNKLFEKLELGLESVIAVEGIVRNRPEKQIVDNTPAGAVEVHVSDAKVISRAEELPFTLKTFNAKPFLLLQYRYLDIRMNPSLQKSLNLRCQVLHKMRRFLIENLGFLEVETPLLSRTSPGGAQEFIVPTREKGKFYGLVQSPQQFKQMLMVGGVDRYFQIARCFRDESGRKDRQPEFTQLDLEMSFCDQEGVLNLIEDLLSFVWPSHLPPLQVPFPRLTHSEAMRLYRTDKPDLRFKMKVVDLTDEMAADEIFYQYITLKFKDLSDLVVEGLILPIQWIDKSRLEGIIQRLSYNYRMFRLEENSEKKLQEMLSDFCNIDTVDIIKSKLDLKPHDVFMLLFGNKKDVERVLKEIQSIDFNKIRSGKPNNSLEFVWITDFPLFETDEYSNIRSVHHPFTQPVPEDIALLDENPLKVRGQHYDLVLNGNEIGGGSIRIHDKYLQRKILKKILQLDESSFQHFLKALSYGAPIHGGFALGIDRLMAILQGSSSIVDVIAFPKFHSGQDPLTGAPCEISDDDKRLYHV